MPAVLTKWSTCITTDAGQKAIPENTALTSLILDENLIGEAGIAALRDMLAKKVRIVLFSIVNNAEVPQEIAEALCRKVPSELLGTTFRD
jgi:hypothetical protein